MWIMPENKSDFPLHNKKLFGSNQKRKGTATP